MKKIALTAIWMLGAVEAQAAPLAINCHQQITQQRYTMTGSPLPTRQLEASVGYVIDFDQRALTVTSPCRSTRLMDGSTRHITVDHEGMTVFGTSQIGREGPVTSEIIHFSRDGARGVGARETAASRTAALEDRRGHTVQTGDLTHTSGKDPHYRVRLRGL